MAERKQFTGEVVRIEANGFGVVRFEKALGANTHGVFSTDLSSFDYPVDKITQGMHVEGVADVDERAIAAIRLLSAGDN